MENGIYHLRRYSGDGEENAVVVITGGAVNGGSGADLYQGRPSVEGTTLSGSIIIRKWNRAPSAGRIRQPMPLRFYLAQDATMR
jgi:hypothetical protein